MHNARFYDRNYWMIFVVQDDKELLVGVYEARIPTVSGFLKYQRGVGVIQSNA